jgi:GR25 family glycosyltransferase involved in LPS biosynthesis
MIGFYGITCRGCEQRKKETDEHLWSNDVNVQWIRGLNGRHAGLQTVHPYTADNPSGDYRIPSGHVALCLNHWFAWQHALLNGCSHAIFFEDDCRVVDGFKEKLIDTLKGMDRLDPKWQFLYLGHLEGSTDAAQKGQCYEWVNGSIGKCKSDPYGTHCYMVKASALPLMIENCERIYANIDITIWNEAIPHLRHYAVVPPLAGQKQDNEIYKNTLG